MQPHSSLRDAVNHARALRLGDQQRLPAAPTRPRGGLRAQLARVTRWIGDDPAFIEPWNVAEPERQLALTLGVPINGSAPELWPLGFKSSGRKLFEEAGVPVPPGFEDLTTVSDAVDACGRNIDLGSNASGCGSPSAQ